MGLGVDFGLASSGGLAGPIVHSLLEWSAVIVAGLVGVLSILHYGIKRDPVTPIIGLALLAAGFMDAFHTLAAGQIITGAADAGNFIPFTWAISRLFNSVIMFAGVGLILLNRDRALIRGSRSFWAVGAVFALSAYAVVHYCATRTVLPQTMFPDAVVTRPWDLAPLILFVLAGATVYPALSRRYPTHFTKAIWIGVILEVVSQLHMTFGSAVLFDAHFNAAHFLKVFAYLAPLVGMLYDWAGTHESEQDARLQLDGARDRWETLARSASDVIVRIDPEGIVRFASRNLTDLATFPKVGSRACEWMSQGSCPNFRALYADILDEHTGRGLEISSLSTAGKEVWFWCRLTPAWENGKLSHVVMSLTDISARKERDAAIRRLASIVNQTSEAIVSMSPEGVIETWNPAAEQLFGYSAREARGKHVSILAPEGHRAQQESLREALRQGGEVKTIETVRVARNGELLDVKIALTPLLDATGLNTGSVAVIRDVRKEHKLASALVEAKNSAEESNAEKSQFLANMSHEIRTPLNGVIGMIQLLQDTDLSEEQLDFVDTLGTSSDALLAVINDILDYSKIEGGHVALEKVTFDPRQLVRETAAAFAGSVRRKGITLSLASDQNVPAALSADPHRIRQVLSNLIGNAVKFTERGGIEVSVRLVQEDNQSHRILFRVSDTGIGMNEDAIGGIFRPFVQADGSTTRNFGGTGLGLAISKSLVERMGGDLGVESTPGAGSTFSFSIACERVSMQSRKDGSDPAGKSPRPAGAGRILVAEDNIINQKVIRALLTKSGYRVDVVPNGIEALEACETGVYDLVLMDCQMPEMGGFEATRRLRERETSNRLPVVALTAGALKGDREKCLAAGMDDYLPKPIVWDDLAVKLAQWIDRTPKGTRPAEKPSRDRPPVAGRRGPVSNYSSARGSA
jgi:PAS domain S-box-containing protein